MVSSHGPTDGAAAAVLLVLLDQAGVELGDVQVTQEHIGVLLRRRHPDASWWGTGVATVYRALRYLEQAGWISVEDVPLADRGALVMCRYRFHVPVHAQAVWERIVDNAKGAAKRGRAAFRARPQPAPAETDPPPARHEHDAAGLAAAREALAGRPAYRPRDG